MKAQALKMAWAEIKKGVKNMEESRTKTFNDYRFSGLNARRKSNKYLTMDRVSSDGNKIVVRVAVSHLIKTRYGYALILDCDHVVFVKDWQVNRNYYGNEVILDREYFNAKKWGEHYEFGESENGEELTFDHWKKTAELQEEAGTKVEWQK